MLISLGLNGMQAVLDGSSNPSLGPNQNLFTAAQSAFNTSSHIDFRNNWEISGGRLTCLETGTKEARLTFDTPLVSGNPHVAMYDYELSAGNIKMQLGGAGTLNARGATEAWQGFQYYQGADVAGNYTRIQPRPSSDFSGSIDDIAVYDLSAFDPNSVACDVVIVGGDSNATNTTSELVDGQNRETTYDPRLWYLPCLRSSPTYDSVGCERHIPFPMIEPVISSASGRRMSPVHAAASRILPYSAARSRPLLIMALGDAGSGLMTTEDWRHPDRRVGSGPTVGRMWDEMVAMKAAMEALGPAHEVIGAIWSLGQNDGFNPSSPDEYDVGYTPEYSSFFEDVRDLFGDIPMVMSNIAPHYVSYADANLGVGFGSHRQTWLNRFDKDSGHANAVSNFRVIEPADGNPVNPNDLSDPHYSAVGMQANGRQMGDALLGLLSAPAGAAPAHTSPPSISPTSAVVDDHMFTRVPGTYTGSPTETVTWVWRKGTTPIVGTENQETYSPTGSTDVASDYNVYETATNSQGSINVTSAYASASLRAQATLALQDQSFTEDTGNQTYDVATDVTANGNTLAHSLVSPPAGVSIAGSVIAFATGAVPVGLQTITVRATDEYGRDTEGSFGLQITEALSSPMNTAAPELSITAGQVGDVINVSQGTWTGAPTPEFTYQWQLDGADVSGATSNSVMTHGTGVWTCIVTATNESAAVSAISDSAAISAAATEDFAIQHVSPVVGTNGGTLAITPVASLDKAIVLNNNSLRQGAGSDTDTNTATTAQEGGLGIRLTATDTITMDRGSGVTMTNQSSASVWEYTGAPDGPNEFIVRDRRTITLSTSDSESFTPAGIVNADKCVPIITGVRCDSDSASSWDNALAASSVNRSSGEVSIEGRGGNYTLVVDVTTVEFTGSNWTVHYATDASSIADNGTLTLSGSVSAWSSAWIMHAFAKNGGNNWNISDIASRYRPGSALNEVDWDFNSAHVGTVGQRHTVYVLENPNMTVTRYSYNATGPITHDWDISSLGLSNTTDVLVDISANTSGSGTSHMRSARSLKLPSVSTLRMFSQQAGSALQAEAQVIQLPSMGEVAGTPGSPPTTTPIGFGENTTGGGTAYLVTNLNDSGPGSLREGAQAGGKNITFAVNGVINLSSRILVETNTTIDGRGSNIRVTGWGLYTNNNQNIIIRNLKIDAVSDDAIKILNANNIWIDHCTLGNTADGALDISDGSAGVTMSWIKFESQNKNNLIGNNNGKTGDVAMRVTIHNCWYDGTERRNPLARYAWVHMFNNLFKNWGTSATGGDCITATYNCQIHLENNVFDAGANKTGVRFTAPGFIEVEGNVRSTGNLLRNGATAVSRNAGSVFDPTGQYTYTPETANAALQTRIEAEAGWQPPSFYA